MKKLIVLAALMTSMLAVNGKAEFLSIPQGPGSAIPNADYGGVQIATIAFSSANAILSFGSINKGAPISIAWIHASSVASSSEFLVIRDTWSLLPGAQSAGLEGLGDYSTNDEVFRLYASSNSGTMYGGNLVLGFDYNFPKPLRTKKGATVKLSSRTWGIVTIGYTQLGK